MEPAGIVSLPRHLRQLYVKHICDGRQYMIAAGKKVGNERIWKLCCQHQADVHDVIGKVFEYLPVCNPFLTCIRVFFRDLLPEMCSFALINIRARGIRLQMCFGIICARLRKRCNALFERFRQKGVRTIRREQRKYQIAQISAVIEDMRKAFHRFMPTRAKIELPLIRIYPQVDFSFQGFWQSFITTSARYAAKAAYSSLVSSRGRDMTTRAWPLFSGR